MDKKKKKTINQLISSEYSLKPNAPLVSHSTRKLVRAFQMPRPRFSVPNNSSTILSLELVALVNNSKHRSTTMALENCAELNLKLTQSPKNLLVLREYQALKHVPLVHDSIVKLVLAFQKFCAPYTVKDQKKTIPSAAAVLVSPSMIQSMSMTLEKTAELNPQYNQ